MEPVSIERDTVDYATWEKSGAASAEPAPPLDANGSTHESSDPLVQHTAEDPILPRPADAQRVVANDRSPESSDPHVHDAPKNPILACHVDAQPRSASVPSSVTAIPVVSWRQWIAAHASMHPAIFYVLVVLMFLAVTTTFLSVVRWVYTVDIARNIVSRHTVVPAGHMSTFLIAAEQTPIFWYRWMPTQAPGGASGLGTDAVYTTLQSGVIIPNIQGSNDNNAHNGRASTPGSDSTRADGAATDASDSEFVALDVDNDDDYERIQSGPMAHVRQQQQQQQGNVAHRSHQLTEAELGEVFSRAVHLFEKSEHSTWTEICGPFNQYDPLDFKIKSRRSCWDSLRMEIIRLYAPKYHQRTRYEHLAQSSVFGSHRDTHALFAKIQEDYDSQYGLTTRQQQELQSNAKKCLCSTEVGFVEYFVLVCEPRVVSESDMSTFVKGSQHPVHPWITQECKFFIEPKFTGNIQSYATRGVDKKPVKLLGSYLSYIPNREADLYQAAREFDAFYKIEDDGEIVHPDRWNVTYYELPRRARMVHFYRDINSNPYSAYKALHGRFQERQRNRHRQHGSISGGSGGGSTSSEDYALFSWFDELRYKWAGGDLKKRETLKDIVGERDRIQEDTMRDLSEWLREYDVVFKRVAARRAAEQEAAARRRQQRSPHARDSEWSLFEPSAGPEFSSTIESMWRYTTWSAVALGQTALGMVVGNARDFESDKKLAAAEAAAEANDPGSLRKLQNEFAQLAADDLHASEENSTESQICRQFRTQITHLAQLNETYLERAISEGLTRECLRTTFSVPRLEKTERSVGDFTMRCMVQCDRKHKLLTWHRGLNHVSKYGTPTEASVLLELFERRVKELRGRSALG